MPCSWARSQDSRSSLPTYIAEYGSPALFRNADKVLLTALKAKLMSDTKLQTMAKTSDPQIFAESIFPKAFGTAAQDSYMESQDTYTTLFEDQAKYNAIMRALGSIIYREMRART